MSREMNVRIIEKDGKYKIGFVSQLYKAGKTKMGEREMEIVEWREAAKTTVERLKRKLESK